MDHIRAAGERDKDDRGVRTLTCDEPYRADAGRRRVEDARFQHDEARNWRIYADFAQRPIMPARRLYAEEEIGPDRNSSAYAQMAPWMRRFRSTPPAKQPCISQIPLHTVSR